MRLPFLAGALLLLAGPAGAQQAVETGASRRAAERLLRSQFGDALFEKALTFQSIESYAAPEPGRGMVEMVVFEMRVEGPDYSLTSTVAVHLDESGNVVRTEGVPDCRAQRDACPPFGVSRAEALATAQRAGLKARAPPSLCQSPGEIIEGFCVLLVFHAGHNRYVWNVSNRETRGWRFWRRAGFDQFGKTALVDAATGKLYEVTGWGSIIDRTQ